MLPVYFTGTDCIGPCHALKSAPPAVAHDSLFGLQQFLSENQLATKSVDGRMNVWDLSQKKQTASWKVSLMLSFVQCPSKRSVILHSSLCWFAVCSKDRLWCHLQVPSCSLGGGYSSRCQFGSTPDGAYICVVSMFPTCCSTCDDLPQSLSRTVYWVPSCERP